MTSFEDFVSTTGRRVQHALMAALGPEQGDDAAADVLLYAWQHWERVRNMENPAGYLFTIGRRRGWRQRTPRRPLAAPPPMASPPWVEPKLEPALRSLSERQRTVVMLVHGAGWTYAEVASLLGIDRGTAAKHDGRALSRLRDALEVEINA